MGSEGQEDQELDQGGHHDRRLQELAREEQYVTCTLICAYPACGLPRPPPPCWGQHADRVSSLLGYAALEKAKLFSKTAQKAKV